MQQVGRYRVLRALGQGGMGQVFLAQDPALGRKVALKLLDRDPNQTLRHEARTLASLNHPNIVTIFEIGEHEGRDFIAMEYLPGKSLREVLDSKPPPSREELLAILSSVVIALSAAHHASILHRDIKPENVVIASNGVKVVDFGIAHRLDERVATATDARAVAAVLTETMTVPNLPLDSGNLGTVATSQTVFGTPAYMAPELLHGEPATPASDVYSLGVVIYECLAGRRPYEATNLIETIAKIITEPPTQLDDPLGPLVVRMLARAPADRPTLREIAAALTPSAPVPKRRGGLVIGIVGLAAVATGAVVWSAFRDTAVDEPVATAPVVEATIAIAPVDLAMPSWGIYGANGNKLADTLADLIKNTGGAKLEAIPIADPELATARREKAQFLVRIKIEETVEQRRLEATVTVFDVMTGSEVRPAIHLSRPSNELGALTYDALRAAVSTIVPGADPPRSGGRPAAQKLAATGRVAIDGGDFDLARTAYEAAVVADDSFPEGWYGLAVTRAWTGADEALVLHAADRAVELAPSGPRHELARGLALFIRHRLPEALGVLEPLESATDLPQAELMFFLGDVNWHYGRFEVAYRYFDRAMQLTHHKARAFAIHSAQYLIARRDATRAPFVVGVAGTDRAELAFALGDYKTLAGDDAHPDMQLASSVVLDRAVTDAQIDAGTHGALEGSLFRVALAAGRGDLAVARAGFSQLWTTYVADHRLTTNDLRSLDSLGEVVICAGMTDEARQVVRVLGDNSRQQAARGYTRLAALTAALARDPSLVVRTELTERERDLVAAVDAELAGDRKTAAKLFTALVANPSPAWDYAERAALIRNLRALHRTKEVASLCKDTGEPAVFRAAFLSVRGLCRARQGQ